MLNYSILIWIILSIQHPASGREHLQSLGEGIEREVLEMAFCEFEQRQSQWFLPQQDEHNCSIVTLTSLQPTSSRSDHILMRTLRHKKLSTLGVLTSLLLLNGVTPVPFSLLLLNFFIQDCNLNFIHPFLLATWYPELRKIIQDWKAAGPNGEVAPSIAAHFMSFHDIQVSHAFSSQANTC